MWQHRRPVNATPTLAPEKAFRGLGFLALRRLLWPILMMGLVWACLLAPRVWAQANNGAAPLLSATELSLENGASSKLQLVLPGPAERAQTFVLSTTVGQVVQVPQRVTLNQGATSVELPVQAVGVGKTVLRVGGATRVLSASITVIRGTSLVKPPMHSVAAATKPTKPIRRSH